MTFLLLSFGSELYDSANKEFWKYKISVLFLQKMHTCVYAI